MITARADLAAAASLSDCERRCSEPLDNDELELEGRKLVVVDTGRTDTTCSTSLHVPSIALIVAGDVVHNGIHSYLAETDTRSRLEWISALDRLEALNPKAVIAGHKIPENDDDPRNIAETRQYLSDFNRLEQTTTTARELYDAMLELYPNRANPGSLGPVQMPPSEMSSGVAQSASVRSS